MITTTTIWAKSPCARYTEEMIEAIFGLPGDKPKWHTIADLLKMNPDKFVRGWADLFWVGMAHYKDSDRDLEKWRDKKGFSEWFRFFDGATDAEFQEGLGMMT